MNKLEKYLEDNYIEGSVVKNLGSWMLYYKREVFPLASTVPSSIERLKELFPEEDIQERNL